MVVAVVGPFRAAHSCQMGVDHDPRPPRLFQGLLRRFAVAVAGATVLIAGGIVPATAATNPPAGAGFDYQIGGSYETAAGAAIVDRDWHESPDPTRYSICYVNAFQAQPEDLRWWRRRHGALLLSRRGRLVMDTAWNEALLDTSTARKRRRLVQIQSRAVRTCAARGYQAVEFDNLDSYSRSRRALSIKANLTFAAMLTKVAHRYGLAVAQKNAVELGSRGKRFAHFDFAIAEECQRYDECDAYESVYGTSFIEVEYSDSDSALFARACALRGSRISVVRRDRDLSQPGSVEYVNQRCA